MLWVCSVSLHPNQREKQHRLMGWEAVTSAGRT